MENEKKTDLKSLPLEELSEKLKEAGYPAFRAKQLYHWLHAARVRDLDEMTNIPAAMKKELSEKYEITRIRTIDRQISRLDGTQKFLFAMPDDCLVESVFMKYSYGNSICISSQVGCRMGCRFCASTLDGLIRNLTPAEMLEQIYEAMRQTGEKISHVVVMGTGEPFDNYDNLLVFLKMLTDENGMNLSRRNVTVSTCGIVPRMLDFAKENTGVTLALSLHATTDARRREIMPVADRYSIRELMDACENYFRVSGRRITFEYSLIAGVNDSEEQAAQLGALARKAHAHVNLIPVNPVKETGYRQPERNAVIAFKNKLEKHGINVSIRRVLGRDIDGACGQLRHRHLLSCRQNNQAETTSEQR